MSAISYKTALIRVADLLPNIPSMAGAPLSGVRIVAVEQFGAGPFGTLHLADLGADIIRLEDPSTGGDVARYIAPKAQGTDSLYFDSFNRAVALEVIDQSGGHSSQA